MLKKNSQEKTAALFAEMILIFLFVDRCTACFDLPSIYFKFLVMLTVNQKSCDTYLQRVAIQHNDGLVTLLIKMIFAVVLVEPKCATV